MLFCFSRSAACYWESRLRALFERQGPAVAVLVERDALSVRVLDVASVSREDHSVAIPSGLLHGEQIALELAVLFCFEVKRCVVDCVPVDLPFLRT